MPSNPTSAPPAPAADPGATGQPGGAGATNAAFDYNAWHAQQVATERAAAAAARAAEAKGMTREQIEKVMRSDRKKYDNSPEMQDKYLSLLDPASERETNDYGVLVARFLDNLPADERRRIEPQLDNPAVVDRLAERIAPIPKGEQLGTAIAAVEHIMRTQRERYFRDASLQAYARLLYQARDGEGS